MSSDKRLVASREFSLESSRLSGARADTITHSFCQMEEAEDVALYYKAKGFGITQIMKLLYYGQCYFLHMTNGTVPLFQEHIEHWDRGPVVPAVWHRRGSLQGLSPTLDPRSATLLDEISITFAGTAEEMSRMSHRDLAWSTTTKNQEMTHALLLESVRERPQVCETVVNSYLKRLMSWTDEDLITCRELLKDSDQPFYLDILEVLSIRLSSI